VNSLGNETLKKSLRVLKPGGKLISISGPPDPAFAREVGKPWILRPVMVRTVLVISWRTGAGSR
jgi:NADPH:quinone reductase-like Zn-dependent oxidoreductase